MRTFSVFGITWSPMCSLPVVSYPHISTLTEETRTAAALVTQKETKNMVRVEAEDARALKQMGIVRVYTPKDFKITEIMSDVTALVEKAWLVKG